MPNTSHTSSPPRAHRTTRTARTSRTTRISRISRIPRVPTTVERQGAAAWIAAARQPDLDPNVPRKWPHEYTHQETAARREKVAQLLTWGYTAGRISRVLNIPYTTVSDDVEHIRTELQLDALPSLQRRLGQSFTVYKEVQRSAWEAFHDAADTSPNKVSALQVAIAAQERIDLLEGTLAPEKINAATIAEVQELVLQALRDVGGPELQTAFLKALHQRARAGMSRLLNSGHTIMDTDVGAVMDAAGTQRPHPFRA